MLQVGIVGLPNVGKSSLFNTLTAAGAPAENYPFCTVEPNVGIVEVPDPRLARIRELAGSEEGVPAHIRFVDIAGLVKGASRGEGLGNQFLGQIREVDVIAHVVRCFEDADVTHVMATLDPVRDAEIIDLELMLADLETVERRREKVEKKARSGEKDAMREMVALDHVHEILTGGEPLRTMPLTDSELRFVGELNLLTRKPVLYVANVGENLDGAALKTLQAAVAEEETAGPHKAIVVPMSLGIEAEVASLEPEDRQEFLAELGLDEEGSKRVIKAAYHLLGLITFFSANEKQTTAWPIPSGTKAPEAAGAIHTDFQKGFIRAEAIAFEDFVELGSMKAAREAGGIRSEGKDYVVQDGDILLFRFNV
jgi:GTP-binding protein YchF